MTIGRPFNPWFFFCTVPVAAYPARRFTLTLFWHAWYAEVWS